MEEESFNFGNNASESPSVSLAFRLLGNWPARVQPLYLMFHQLSEADLGVAHLSCLIFQSELSFYVQTGVYLLGCNRKIMVKWGIFFWFLNKDSLVAGRESSTELEEKYTELVSKDTVNNYSSARRWQA